MNASSSRPRTFRWLLKREFWENRGGFLWAPLLTGGIAVLLSLLLGAAGGAWLRSAAGDGSVVVDGAPLRLQGHQLSQFADAALTSGVVLTGVVLGFVVFFYALGALYDDRRDRSVLFWKSLPVSDAHTVLSKAAWALVLAPLLAAIVGLAVGLALWLVTLAVAAFSGATGGAAAVLDGSNPLRMIGAVAAALPVHVLWALPAVGWLLFCSAWARSKPFLMAVLVPVLACLAAGMIGALPGLALPVDRVWYALVYRGLLSVFPGSWQHVVEGRAADAAGTPAELLRAIDLSGSWQSLGSIDLWIGAVIGAALIAASIPLRRMREAAD